MAVRLMESFTGWAAGELYTIRRISGYKALADCFGQGHAYESAGIGKGTVLLCREGSIKAILQVTGSKGRKLAAAKVLFQPAKDMLVADYGVLPEMRPLVGIKPVLQPF